MNSEERQKLCGDLQEVALMWGGGSKQREITKAAADELERLDKAYKEWRYIAVEIERRAALVQSSAEPVVPRPLGPDGKPLLGWYYDEYGVCRPYHPDAFAGLIEAAEWHEELAKEKLKQVQQAPEAKKLRFLDISFFHDECASTLRARAADRSGK